MDTPAIPIRAAAAQLCLSTATVYARIKTGDLHARNDPRGRLLVTKDSIQSYLDCPPAGSWARRAATADGSTTGSATGASSMWPGAPTTSVEDLSRLRQENLLLRESVSRLQMAREKDAAARQAAASATKHLIKALHKQQVAQSLTSEANVQLDELVTQLLTPGTIEGVSTPDP